MTDIIDDIFKSIATAEELNKKTNNQLADLLIEHILGSYAPLSPQADLIEAIIKRLQGYYLKIVKCSDPLMWYADKVGQRAIILGENKNYYLSREDSGYVNIIKKCDAKIDL
jgi:hypothetical protein